MDFTSLFFVQPEKSSCVGVEERETDMVACFLPNL